LTCGFPLSQKNCGQKTKLLPVAKIEMEILAISMVLAAHFEPNLAMKLGIVAAQIPCIVMSGGFAQIPL
jgi:hypothetical protein